MAVLLPTHQVEDLRAGLIDYLSTTFALTDREARAGLQAFLEDQSDGIFKGPFVRLRLPFEPASDGWRNCLDWYEGFAPYGHQAHAFQRLTSKLAAGAPSTFRRPEPTLVTTGTGSGKTESFLYPILDHVLRAKAAGITGMKALILYPMNALANDQAQRLARMLTENPELGGITAGIYTGQRGGQRRTTVSAAGLISSREIFRSEAPDILLTNYKMLDMLLLREDDAPIWQQSATSLQFVVLDEFHTYDGAQGTDVAMLLRRLGLTLKCHWPADLSSAPFGPTEEDRARPLGRITPVATSATLGAKGESEPMLRFAETVFGETFPDDAVVTESRLSIDSWASPEYPGASEELARVAAGLEETTKVIEAALFAGAEDPNAVIVEHVSKLLFGRQPENLLEAVRPHPLTRAVLREANDAVALEVLARRVLGEFNATGGPRRRDSLAKRHIEFMAHFLALLSHVRAQYGRDAVAVETHLWVRELSRIDKSVDAEHHYRWNDDGPHTDQTLHLPAIYCRHCGRSGWGAVLGPTGADLENDDSKIRREAATGNPRFRALIHAPNEDAHRAETGSIADGLRWLDTVNRTILAEPPAEDSPEAHEGRIVPVLMLLGQDADDQSKDEYCPACQTKDGIRFLGSAIATMLSVSISNLFGADGLDSGEKKALVFTDSVQDAAHRAGFVQARSHILTLRSAFRNALEISAPGGGAATLQEMVDAALADATTPVRRYQLIAPDYADRPQFKAYWDPAATAQDRLRATRNAQKRVLFDASIEFGLQSRLGRTLELTGAIVAETDAGSPAAMLAAARTALEAMPGTLGFEGDVTDDAAMLAWVRGVVERVRIQGGIRHKWLESYMGAAGAKNQRWQIWGGRRRSEGMPAFPRGRSAPAFPRLGGGDPGEMDPIASTQSWYTRWTTRCVKLPAADATYVAKALFGQLAEQGVLESVTAKDGATLYALPTDRILLQAPRGEDVGAGKHFLACSVCRAVTPGTQRVVDELDGANCLYVRCPGHLVRQAEEDNFYRKLYATREPKRVVASEHTSLLPDEVRLKIEDQFKSSAHLPDAPNVLVATPTLEMGIDIGDLSCVMLASLPTSVSSYLQRVGRAGRLTGNSLVLAYARGRGEHLPKLHDPLSVINGEVRPPATFLDAEEILQRQYLAHLVDRFARDARRPHPRKASSALGDDKPGSFLGDLIAAAHEHAGKYLAEFLGQFGSLLSPVSQDRLREWASPREDGSSELAEHVVRAARLWAADCNELQSRIDEIEKTLPELRARAESNAATDEDLRAPKSAEATQKMLRGQLFDLRGEYWISVLEKYGLLPNYTLLDDSVNFDIGVTTQDAESLEYHTETISLQRGAAIAINELAPGATFYSRGLEVKIDAVDLGPQQSHVQRWQVCPECGWINTDAGNEGGLVKACGRCKLGGIADVSQQFDVVIMKKVSAEVRRDEVAIGDRNDQRVKERFNTVLAADIDPEHVTDEWFLEDFEFGAKYANRVQLRWLNLGRASVNAAPRVIAGNEAKAPLFRVCSYCGKLDTGAKSNSPEEHRFWCKNRKSSEEHVAEIALARVLKTQGVSIRLPAGRVLGDDFALPSLTAALLLGLREVIGGSPDHIAAVPINEQADGGTAVSLLLHDKVPGGTGYLAEFGEPRTVWNLLHAAWDVVRNCECRNEERLACHRCLLPFAPPWQVEHVARVTSERLLRNILAGKDGAADDGEPSFDDWKVTDVPPVVVDIESHLEVKFRKALVDRLSAVGAHVKVTPGIRADKVEFRLPGAKHIWWLEPQVDIAGTRPDFLLSTADPNIPRIAIYTDGYMFHASPEHNRVADDAAKRQALRAVGVIPWAVTWEDIDAFSETGTLPAPPWFTQKAAGLVQSGKTPLKPKLLAAVHQDAVSQLWQWIQDPDVEGWADLSDAVPLLAMGTGLRFKGAVLQLAEYARASLDNEAATPASGPNPCWTYADGPLRFAAGATSSVMASTAVVLLLDSRDEAVAQTGYHEVWREWLRLSNLLAFKHVAPVIGAVTLAQPAIPVVVEPGAFGKHLSPEWQELLDLATAAERGVLEALAEVDGLPLPELGYELSDGTPLDIAWPDLRVAVVLAGEDLGLPDGWVSVGSDIKQIAHVLKMGASHG
jgi:ATP-dependent helicase YprA (DUF1998 family)